MTKRYTGWLFTMSGVGVDALLIAIGFNLAWWLRYRVEAGASLTEDKDKFVPLANYAGMRLSYVLVILLVFATAGVYRMPRGRKFMVEACRSPTQF